LQFVFAVAGGSSALDNRANANHNRSTSATKVEGGGIFAVQHAQLLHMLLVVGGPPICPVTLMRSSQMKTAAH
jgi:hypothetical protein